jgi:hypothetical protein
MKTSIIILLLLYASLSKAQKLDGIWMSYDDYIIDSDKAGRPIGEGLLIDFDNKTIGHIRRDTMIRIGIDFEKKKIFIETDTLISLNYQVKNKDSLEIDFGQNMVEIFKPIDLNSELQITKNQISKYLTTNDFEDLGGEMNIKFSDKDFNEDLNIEKTYRRKTLINHTLNTNGYWYIREIKSNFFLVFTLEYIPDIHIFQILKVSPCKITLNQIKLPEVFSLLKNEVTELKTCL